MGGGTSARGRSSLLLRQVAPHDSRGGRASAALALRVSGGCALGRPRRWVVCHLLAARGVLRPAPGGQLPREVSCGKRRHLWAGPVLLETPTQPLPGRGRGEACQRAGFGDRTTSPGVGRVAWPRTQGSLRGDRAATGPHSPGFPGCQPLVLGSQPWVRGSQPWVRGSQPWVREVPVVHS